MTEYLSLGPKPDFFILRLRLRPPNFIAENFHLSRRMRYMVFFPLIDHKSFERGFVLSLPSSSNRNLPNGKLALLSNSYKNLGAYI